MTLTPEDLEVIRQVVRETIRQDLRNGGTTDIHVHIKGVDAEAFNQALHFQGAIAQSQPALVYPESISEELRCVKLPKKPLLPKDSASSESE